MREKTKQKKGRKRNIFLTRTNTHNEACGWRITCDVVSLFCCCFAFFFRVFAWNYLVDEESEDEKEAIGLGPSRSVDLMDTKNQKAALLSLIMERESFKSGGVGASTNQHFYGLTDNDWNAVIAARRRRRRQPLFLKQFPSQFVVVGSTRARSPLATICTGQECRRNEIE